MLNNTEIPEAKQTPLLVADRTLKPYHKPWLLELGDLRTLTLGGSPGVGDSGGTFTTRLLPDFGFDPGIFPDSGEFTRS